MEDFIQHIKSKQNEYEQGSDAYNVLRHLEAVAPNYQKQ